MKKVFLIGLLIGLSFTPINAQSDLQSFFTITDQLMTTHVEDGKVNYESLSKNTSSLNQLVDAIASMNLTDASAMEKKAFYINAYNVLVIHSIIQHYPTSSPQSISGFFDANQHQVANTSYTLNGLEKNGPLKPKEDPRLHFALVCAAKGCPRIQPFAYQPHLLEQQLDEATTYALNDPTFIKVNPQNEKVELSQIFNWYKSDFTANATSVVDYINGYRKTPLKPNFKTSFYTYDWSLNATETMSTTAVEEKSNIQTFTPSALFKKGQYEVNVFNGIYAQNAVRNRDGERTELGRTESFSNTMIQLTTGVSESGRFNVGLDFYVSRARYAFEEESALNVFSNQDASYARTALSYIGPRIKFNPLKSIPRLSVQSVFLIPVAKNLETPNFTAHDRYTSWTQIFFDKDIGTGFQLFLEADMLYRIDKNSTAEGNFFRVPLSAFLSYFPSSKSTFYVFSQYSPRYETVSNEVSEEFGLSQWFTQIGVGTKYQLTDRLGFEVTYGNFVASRLDGAGHVISFGARYIRR